MISDSDFQRAENEVDRGVYSISLWERAYQRADGDSDKAYHIYIQWRAHQLSETGDSEEIVGESRDVFGIASSTCASLSIPSGIVASFFNKLDGPGGFDGVLYFFVVFSLFCLLGLVLGMIAVARKEKPHHHIACFFCFLGALPTLFILIGGFFEMISG